MEITIETVRRKKANPMDDDVSDMGSVHSRTSVSTSLTSESSVFDHVNKGHEPREVKVATKEQKWVDMAKYLVAGVLLTAVAIMSTTTFLLITREEHKTFVGQFKNYASEIIAVSQENSVNTFRSIDSLSLTISSYSEDTNKKWPFVTLPHFDARASAIESLGGVRLLSFSPVVHFEQKTAWEKYTQKNARKTFQQSIDYQDMNNTDAKSLYLWPNIYQGNLKTFQFAKENGPGPYLPMWQLSRWRPELSGMVNYNLNDEPRVKKAFATTLITKSPTLNFFVITGTADSVLVQPIFDRVNGGSRRQIVGILWVLIDWINYFKQILPDHIQGIVAVVKSTDGDVVSYQINGMEAEFLGEGDLHDTKYDNLEVSAKFADLEIENEDALPEDMRAPVLSMHLYPSDTLRDSFRTNDAYYYTGFVVFVFAFTTVVFIIFDLTVRRHQAKVMERIMKQDAIVTDLLPQHIRDRLYGADDDDLSGLDGDAAAGNDDDKPIADLYPSATVLYADIEGFGPWSSQREPDQVFLLLEGVFGAFDEIASRLGVFKVETVGDTYLAVCGLPEPRKKHASVMARFSRDCLLQFKQLVRKLEITLGPDTTDMELRIGMHSGQVTAGVLRGKNSRYQLFGETVNVCETMNHSAEGGCIQVSNMTAELLRKEGKGKWVIERDEKIEVDGKGFMTTCYIKPKRSRRKAKSEDSTSVTEAETNVDVDDDSEEGEVLEEEEEDDYTAKLDRLVEWNVEVMSKLLKDVLAARHNAASFHELRRAEKKIGDGTNVPLDEFKEIISLPKVTVDDVKKRKDPKTVIVDEEVIAQLRDLISKIARMYHPNSFHNFEHASHVAASVRKLLTRIVNSGNQQNTHVDDEDEKGIALFDESGNSYGITSDPLTQFAVIFSAIIHDADHPGVPNAQLLKEDTEEAKLYEKSIAEQNSVDLCWQLLMRPEYQELRDCIYCNGDELKRFRQLLVNVVMATDICDKELGALRKSRWTMAFSPDATKDESSDLVTDRKATIILEHLIQASDVSHTMQHWQIYILWNERFFFELYSAYMTGRAENDPTNGWYKGEIGFYDFYIIPLAKKLANCGVFGVSSYEYLNYAQANRDRWQREGESIVEGFLVKYRRMHPDQFEDCPGDRRSSMAKSGA